MGWEWHDRQRDSNGRYTNSPGRHFTQLHLRLTTKQAELVRSLAVKRCKSLSDYVCWAIYKAEKNEKMKEHRGPTVTESGYE